jgi:hypothetical protein
MHEKILFKITPKYDAIKLRRKMGRPYLSKYTIHMVSPLKYK